VTASHSDAVTVLVVDDDRAVADVYADLLETHHDVRRAYGGSAGLDALDEVVDGVILDREMPRVGGVTVAEAIDDRPVDPWIVMVTGVDPTVDVLELPVDDYLTKPVGRTALLDVVATMIERETYEYTLQEYFSLAAKKAALEAEKPPAELSASRSYQRVLRRLDELGDRADCTVDRFDDEFVSLFEEITGGR
jgi:DNA-binding response OmpR family regulator